MIWVLFEKFIFDSSYLIPIYPGSSNQTERKHYSLFPIPIGKTGLLAIIIMLCMVVGKPLEVKPEPELSRTELGFSNVNPTRPNQTLALLCSPLSSMFFQRNMFHSWWQILDLNGYVNRSRGAGKAWHACIIFGWKC